MKVLITGAKGQLGTELRATAPADAQIIPTDVTSLDITNRQHVKDFAAENEPDLIINAAAYTAVDRAESEPELAFRINRDGAAHLAEAAQATGAHLIHISTDYVFDGKQSTPYKPDDQPNPINAYGASKRAGELAVTERSEGSALIVRTAWLYSAHGNNFLKTMLRLLRETKEVRVVCDQIGTPTNAGDLARAIWRFAVLPESRGIYHWTDAGVASWYDFADAIAEATRSRAMVTPIPSSDYSTPVKRPSYGVLDKVSTWRTIGRPSHWRSQLCKLLTTEGVKWT